jgi:acetoin utilization deacetylase AcuC-like enzyme
MILYDPLFELDLPDYGIGIPVSASRSATIMRYLAQQGSAFSVYSLAFASALAGISGPVISRNDLERVHAKEYIARLYNEGPGPESLKKELLAAYELINPDGSYNRYEPAQAVKPLADVFHRLLQQVAGSYLAARLALMTAKDAPYPNFCYYLGGGMHHARYDAPSGFCLLNDVVIAARKIQAEGRASLIWIIDVDAHKGDGSAELVAFSRQRQETFADKNPQIITLSAHMAQGWPLDAESLAQAKPNRAPLIPSDIDIPIEEHQETQYNALLTKGFAQLEGLSGEREPDLVLVVDGVDCYEKDGLASSAPLALTLEQCVARDNLIFSFVQERRLPSAWIMAGGYGGHAWEPTARFLASLTAKPV